MSRPYYIINDPSGSYSFVGTSASVSITNTTFSVGGYTGSFSNAAIISGSMLSGSKITGSFIPTTFFSASCQPNTFVTWSVTSGSRFVGRFGIATIFTGSFGNGCPLTSGSFTSGSRYNGSDFNAVVNTASFSSGSTITGSVVSQSSFYGFFSNPSYTKGNLGLSTITATTTASVTFTGSFDSITNVTGTFTGLTPSSSNFAEAHAHSCSLLSSVNLSNQTWLTSIDFISCSNLRSLTFDGCTNMQNVTLSYNENLLTMSFNDSLMGGTALNNLFSALLTQSLDQNIGGILYLTGSQTASMSPAGLNDRQTLQSTQSWIVVIDEYTLVSQPSFYTASLANRL